jgi:hypothetical protein
MAFLRWSYQLLVLLMGVVSLVLSSRGLYLTYL